MSKEHSKNKKIVLILTSLLLILCCAIGGSLALLMERTNEIKNTFQPTDITTSVEEILDGSVKKDVVIKNTGTTDAYIRVALVATWQDVNGNVYGKAPNPCEKSTCNHEQCDYLRSFNFEMQCTGICSSACETCNCAGGCQGCWLIGADGYYYWSNPVAPNETTGVLLVFCEPIEEKTPAGYAFNLEILGSGIQSVSENAVIEWSSGIVEEIDENGTLCGDKLF